MRSQFVVLGPPRRDLPPRVEQVLGHLGARNYRASSSVRIAPRTSRTLYCRGRKYSWNFLFREEGETTPEGLRRRTSPALNGLGRRDLPRYVRTLRLMEQVGSEQPTRNSRFTFGAGVIAGRTLVPAGALNIELTGRVAQVIRTPKQRGWPGGPGNPHP